MTTIKRIKAIPGYGERYIVNSKEDILYNFFHTICLWTTNTKWENDGSCTKTFELPVGITYDNSPILKYIVTKYNVTIED